MLRRTASAGDFEHFHFLPDAATSSTVMAGRATGMMSRPGNQMRPESSKPFDILEVGATSTECVAMALDA